MHEFSWRCGCKIRGIAPYVKEIHLCAVHSYLTPENRRVKVFRGARE